MRNGDYNLVRAPPAYPGKRYRGKYIYEHHLVWWEHTGQLVPDKHVIHHRDENKRNIVFSNLELKTAVEHSAEHNRREKATVPCGFCGGVVTLRPSVLRTRLKASMSGKVYCSRSHQVKAQKIPG
jgi:hypothetical protein